MTKNLTKSETLRRLKLGSELSTAMLKSLGLPFEAFLAYVQRSKKIRGEFRRAAIKKLEAESGE